MKRTAFRIIVGSGFVWPWVVMAAVDGYLGTGRLRNFFAVYTDTPVLYLLLFISQALWSAVPFIALAMFAREAFTRSAMDASADSWLRRTSVVVSGVGALALLSWSQAVAWLEYFLAPSGTVGIAVALAVPPLLGLISMPIIYGVGVSVGRMIVGAKR